MTAREQLIQAVLDLPESEVEPLLKLVNSREDSASRWLDSLPLEDEEISPEEEAAVQEARDELAAGGGTISLEDAERKYGLA